MNRVLIFTLALLTFLLAACGEQLAPTTPTPIPLPSQPQPTPIPSTPAPSPAPAPGAQVSVNDEFWYGSITHNGISIPGGMGFWQTGNAVATVVAFTGADGEVVTFPRMTGTIEGYTLTINYTDAVGDVGIISGTFDRSQTTFSGTFTLTVGGERTVFGLSMSYHSQLGTRLQTQSVTTFRELIEQFK